MVYNIAANAQIHSPIAAYQRGKALRLAEGRAQAQEDRAVSQEARAQSAFEQNTQLANQREGRAQEKHDIDVETAQLTRSLKRAEAQMGLLDSIKTEEQFYARRPALVAASPKGSVPEEYDAEWVTDNQTAISEAVISGRRFAQLTEAGKHEQAAAVKKEYEDAQEIKGLKSELDRATIALREAQTEAASATAEYRRSAAAAGPKPTSPGSASGPQLTQAETILEKTEGFENLKGSDSDLAIQWVANRAREIQNSTSISFTDALAVAAQDAKQHMSTKEGWIFDTEGGEFNPYEAGSPPEVSSAADYNDLQPGTEFIDPDGNLRRKPAGGLVQR